MRCALLVLTFAACLALAATLRADTISIISGQGTLDFPNVQIAGVSDGKISFRTSAGHPSDRDFAQVAHLSLNDQPVLNQAEDAFAARQWNSAGDLYRQILATTTTSWLKAWAAQRMIAIGQKSNRFDTAADGYVALVLSDATSATNLPPILPDAHSAYLPGALTSVQQALTTQALSDAQKQELMTFQLDLQRATGDQKGADATLEELLQSNSAVANDPAQVAQLARLRLQQAAMALDKSDFAGATHAIRSNSRYFVEPREQAQALYFLAEAQAGIATTKNDTAAWQDAALAYMRVVAHFKASPGAPFVALSLVKTAQIEEKLNHPTAARSLYGQVIDQYPQDPAVATARAGYARLQKSP